jgi:hypothetical protein
MPAEGWIENCASSPCKMMSDTPSFGHVRPTAPLRSRPRHAPRLIRRRPAAPIRKLRLLKIALPYRTRILGGI